MKIKKDELTVLSMIMVAVLVVMGVFTGGSFFSLGNLQGMAFQLPELGILAFSMMVVLITGGINLSIIASANMTGITTALILKNFEGSTPSLVLFSAIFAGLAVAALVGLFNGFLIAYIGITPILATLGTMTLLNGIAIVVTKGYVISGFPDSVLFLGNGTVFGIPFPLLIFALMAMLLSMFLNKTKTGFCLYMIGSNDAVTRFSGIDNAKVLMKAYLVSGIYSGVAALVMISRFNSAKSGYGNSYLLVSILACVLGGVSSAGGFGRVLGVVLSLITLQMLSSGFNLLRVNSFLTTAIWGFVMILVMVINYLIDHRKRGYVK
ncbi:permease component of ribose/xylose/arabinose/galactoside ABC-type transporters [Sphaerochaeta pleomorpha str. Grapes]|uniref:Permease component of ribose/xylose/arabinose/galactoside ABC-type transporters n=1 Tax=Sphaerochaeta pleomorpha (strain ATCC BAA-1885 / DSM 22778 / Grapes) TaxID=158190 RepID=G8QVP3_SPHPG|nr:ABC transporter permease [Sphaerochaeta pleomorpha]AEV29335.1 permease component of ribose/xylose/arabinose/galactoside ABC-type transporters [Sphaerochaeta pleomorpha str. Grapes]